MLYFETWLNLFENTVLDQFNAAIQQAFKDGSWTEPKQIYRMYATKGDPQVIDQMYQILQDAITQARALERQAVNSGDLPPEGQGKCPDDLQCFCDDEHLICTPYTIDNLHRMAKSLGIHNNWFHNTPGKAHYDIPMRRGAEIKSKAKYVSPRDIVKIIRGRYTPE